MSLNKRGLFTHIDVDDKFHPRGQSWCAHVCGGHIERDHSIQIDVDPLAVHTAYAGYFPRVLIDSEIATVFPRRNAVLDSAVGSAWLIIISSLNKNKKLLKLFL